MGSGTGGCALRNPPYIIRPSGPAQPHSSSGEDSMQVSRRDFLQLTASAGAGTAIGGLVGLGVTLAPAMARAQELRIKDAKTTPSICPFCSVGCATLKNGQMLGVVLASLMRRAFAHSARSDARP